MVWNLFPYKSDCSFGKSQILQGTKGGLLGGLSHLDDLMSHQKSACDMVCEQAHCSDADDNHQVLWPSELSK